MSGGLATTAPFPSSLLYNKHVIWCVQCAKYVDQVTSWYRATCSVCVFVVQCHDAIETIELHDTNARALDGTRLFVAFTAQSTSTPRRATLLHPDDPHAALVHADQWCPFLTHYWSGTGSNAPPSEPLLDYDDRQNGCMTWVTSDWWCGNYDGWRVHVQVGPRYERIPDNRSHWRETGTWYVSVGGDDDTSCCIELPSYNAVRELLLRFPLVLTKRWLHDVGFVFG